MNDSARHAVEGVRTLWPFLEPHEKVLWTERLAPIFLDDFMETVRVLSSKKEIPQ